MSQKCTPFSFVPFHLFQGDPVLFFCLPFHLLFFYLVFGRFQILYCCGRVSILFFQNFCTSLRCRPRSPDLILYVFVLLSSEDLLFFPPFQKDWMTRVGCFLYPIIQKLFFAVFLSMLYVLFFFFSFVSDSSLLLCMLPPSTLF